MRLPLLAPAVLLGLLLGLLLAPGRAAADSFLLRDGTTVEGEVLRVFKDDQDRPSRWEVRTLKGNRILGTAEVRSQKPGGGPWPWRVFEEKFAFIDRKDPEDNYRLGLWAREQGLEAEAARAFLRAIEANPDFAKARTALGHQRVGDKWVVPGNQVPVPEERGSPVPPGGPSNLEGTLGHALLRRETDNFRVESTYLDQPALGRYLDSLERSRDATLALLGEPPPPGEIRRPTFLLLADAAQYASAVDALVAPATAARADAESAARELRQFRAGHLAILPGRPGGCIEWRIDENETADRAFVSHFAVHDLWRADLAPGTRDPDWLAEAVAYGAINELFPDDPAYCLATGYGRRDRLPDEWRNTRIWPATARNLAVSGKALAFRDLATLDLNSLSFASLVQAWSVLQALRAKDENATRTFLRKVRRGIDQFKALQESLRLDPAGVDKAWKAEMLKGR